MAKKKAKFHYRKGTPGKFGATKKADQIPLTVLETRFIRLGEVLDQKYGSNLTVGKD